MRNEIFQTYFYGRKFTIYTDHRPLQISLKKPKSKLVRWRLKLDEHDYDILYKKKKINANAEEYKSSLWTLRHDQQHFNHTMN